MCTLVICRACRMEWRVYLAQGILQHGGGVVWYASVRVWQELALAALGGCDGLGAESSKGRLPKREDTEQSFPANTAPWEGCSLFKMMPFPDISTRQYVSKVVRPCMVIGRRFLLRLSFRRNIHGSVRVNASSR